MKLFVKAALAASVAFTSTSAVAASGVVVEANGAHAQDRWGGELGVGYGFGTGGFKLRPLIGAFIIKGDNDRYYTDEFDNGQSQCRDSETGQFAKETNCTNLDLKPYARIEGTYSIPSFAEVGGGVRLSAEKVAPYGTIAFSSSKVRIKANVGPGYCASGLQFGF